jgi:ABC-2 type transport system ATP-binding protein
MIPDAAAQGARDEATTSPAHVVSVRALTRAFAEQTAVDALTFGVGAGELFGIVGPDGAGKTTTLRMLAGVLPPTSGDAEILGTSVARAPEQVKPHIAYMSQRFGLYTDLTVRENIMFYADLYRVPRAERPARLQQLYAFSRLGEFEHRLAGQLSGGMKQKLSLCCALIHQPRVLLLDEPTFGVDPISRRELWLILHRMVADGMTVIVTTSYMDEAERCDRVALLHNGRLLMLDTPERVQRQVAGRLVGVRSDAPRQTRDALRQLPQVVSATLFGDRIHVVARHAIDATLRAQFAATAGATGVDELEPSLEDAFIDLVGVA